MGRGVRCGLRKAAFILIRLTLTYAARLQKMRLKISSGRKPRRIEDETCRQGGMRVSIHS
jgi:hypothetical protein